MRHGHTILVALLAHAGCGDGNVCVQACERSKSCARTKLASIDCNDPQLKPVCDLVNQALAVDCSQAGGAACAGEFKAQSERTMSCSLDPLTCICPRNVCLEACREQKDCAETSLDDLDCSAAANQTTCTALKAMDKDCYAIPDSACSGTVKAEAEKIDSCFLDHTTCVCR